MNNLATQETWMMAFGKDFGGMCQGDNRSGQKGIDTMFGMTPVNIPIILANQIVAYGNVVVNHCPLKEGLN
jgi:hypothetical protein